MTGENGSEMLDAALAYARRGLPIFPVSRSKVPLVSHGFKDASADEAQVREWWGRWPDANIGMPTGERTGLLVVDVDRKSGGLVSLERLMEANGVENITTPHVETGGGGLHFYFKADARFGQHSGEPNSEVAGIDYRGATGYVVVPPSQHLSGKRYEGEVPDPSECAEIPDWLAAPLLEHGPRKKVVTSLDGGPIAEGGRNDTLFRVGCSLRAQGWEREQIEAHLKAVNEARCKPPLGEHELDLVVGQACGYERGVSDGEVVAQFKERLAKMEGGKPPQAIPETAATEIKATIKAERDELDKALDELESKEAERKKAVREEIRQGLRVRSSVDLCKDYLGKEMPWIHPPFLMRGEVTLLVGAANVGKTTFILQMLLRGASGEPWFLSSKPSKATYRSLYVSLEMGEIPLSKRLNDVGGPHPNLVTSCPALFTFSVETWDALGEFMRELHADVLVIDNLFGADLGFDLNKQEGTARLMNDARAFAQLYNVGVMIVHHTRKGQKNSAVFGTALENFDDSDVLDEASGSKVLVNRAAIRVFIRKRGNSRRLYVRSRFGAPRDARLGWDYSAHRWKRSSKDEETGHDIETVEDELNDDSDSDVSSEAVKETVMIPKDDTSPLPTPYGSPSSHQDVPSTLKVVFGKPRSIEELQDGVVYVWAEPVAASRPLSACALCGQPATLERHEFAKGQSGSEPRCESCWHREHEQRTLEQAEPALKPVVDNLSEYQRKVRDAEAALDKKLESRRRKR